MSVKDELLVHTPLMSKTNCVEFLCPHDCLAGCVLLDAGCHCVPRASKDEDLTMICFVLLSCRRVCCWTICIRGGSSARRGSSNMRVVCRVCLSVTARSVLQQSSSNIWTKQLRKQSRKVVGESQEILFPNKV